MRKNKSKAKDKVSAPERSKIIEQCVIYVQQLAAYDVGFGVDRTSEAEHCGKGGQIKKARRAMSRLIDLGGIPGASLTPLELRAKAGVLAGMYGLRKHEDTDEIETTYIRLFAREVVDYLAANHQADE
jgi:hypothetical protein